VTAEAATLAIIIPTHDRRASLERTLRAFAAQSYPRDAIEIIVVADGCSDGTAEIVRERWPVPVRVIQQTRQGAAVARNRGAAVATADLLVFLDDDVEVWPGFLDAHVQGHADQDPARVVIGYLPPDLQGRRDFFAVMLRAWWEAMFDPLRDPGHRFSYSDLLSGNFSIRRSLFDQLGGFDETLRCHEDYELGFRLIAAGARFAFAEAAAGWHHEYTDLRRALQRKRDEGRADVALARRHPELTPSLPLCRHRGQETRRGRLLRDLALARPAAGDWLERRCRSWLYLLETARLRTRWRRLLDELLSYWYWRGVGESMDYRVVGKLCRSNDSTEPTLYDLDLQAGLAAAIRELDDARPEALRLRWGTLVIATMPPEPGAEPLQGRHLPSLLRRRFGRPLGEALARTKEREGGTVSTSAAARLTDTAADDLSMRGT
jgi:GT2 family glycosyltransferase